MKKYLYSLGIFFAICSSAYGVNEFYTHGTFPVSGSSATSSSMRAEFDLIAAGFEKLPPLAGNANKLVTVNSGATGLTATGTLASPVFSGTATGTYTLGGTPTIASPVLSGTATGTYTLAGTPTISSSVNLVSGNIVFPAGQVPSAGVNTLDDYEEGTWTPSVGGTATYTSRSGEYTKIGRLVFVRSSMAINTIGTGSAAVISGLPFTSANTGLTSCVVGTTGGLAIAVASITGVVNILATDITLLSRTAANVSDGGLGVLGNGASIAFSCTYQT